MRQCKILELTPGSREPEWLISGWDKLARGHKEIRLFQSPVWVLNYWKYRRAKAESLHLLVGRDEDEIIGIIPWVNDSRRFNPSLSNWRTVHASGEYDADWTCHPDYQRTFVQMACDFLEQKKYSWFRYQHNAMLEDSGILDALAGESRRRGFAFRYQVSREIPFLETMDPRPIEQRISRKYRQEIRRRERKLRDLDSVVFEDVDTGDSDLLQAALGELFTVEAAGWKGHTGTAIASDPQAEQFWRMFARDAALSGVLRLHLLRLGKKVIAGQLGAVYGETYYSLKLGYDEQFRKYGPGALITRHVIQSCIDDPVIEIYDFAGPAMPYMSNWTNSSRRAGMVTLATPRSGVSTLFELQWYGRKKLSAIRGAGSVLRPESSDVSSL